jgi:hypothetical protein
MSNICFNNISTEVVTLMTKEEIVISFSFVLNIRLLIISWHKLIKPGLVNRYGLFLGFEIFLFTFKAFEFKFLSIIIDFKISHLVR